MCDDPDCAGCNPAIKQSFVKEGMELADAIIEVLNTRTPRIGDTTENGLAGYVSSQIQAVAFASAMAAMITNLKVEATQELLLTQIIANTRTLIASQRLSDCNETPVASPDPWQGTVH